jgi:hypothetical protein
VKRLNGSHFQFRIDKVAAHLAPWKSKHFNIAERKTPLKSVLTAQAIYPLTATNVPLEPLEAIKKLILSFFWVDTNKASSASMKF